MIQKPDETWISISGKYLINVFETAEPNRFVVTFNAPNHEPVPNCPDFSDLHSAMQFVEELENSNSQTD